MLGGNSDSHEKLPDVIELIKNFFYIYIIHSRAYAHARMEKIVNELILEIELKFFGFRKFGIELIEHQEKRFGIVRIVYTLFYF